MSFPLLQIMLIENPWQVRSIQAFSCLKCPECAFITKEEKLFQNHALQNHPMCYVGYASIFFGVSNSNSVTEPHTTKETNNQNIKSVYSKSSKFTKNIS